MTRATIAWALLVALAACGGEDDGGGDEGPGDALHPVPRDWFAGEQLGYALISHQSKLPTALTMQSCAIDTQLATATEAGALPESAAEDTCIVTDTTSWTALGADPAPACAGVIRFEWGSANRSLTVCGDAFTMPIEVMCGSVADADGVRVTSGPDGIEGDVLASLDALAEAPGVPTIRSPEPQGEGTALWPEGPDLRVEWDAQGADGVEIVLGQTTGTGPTVRCLTADDGTFTIPATLVAPYRSGRAYVEVAAMNQSRTTPDGFTFRTTFRESDAIWLF